MSKEVKDKFTKFTGPKTLFLVNLSENVQILSLCFFGSYDFNLNFFWPLGAGAGAARKQIPGAGAFWKKNQEPEPLDKKVSSRSR